jgi:hypothetical protein
MSFLAKLKIDNQEYNILECSYSCHQNTDPSGKPLGVTRGGQFKVKIESNGKTGFIDWMLSPNKTKDGSITFYKRDAMSRLQEIKFEKAYCINFSEYFNAKNTEPLQTEILISAKKMTFEDVAFENAWKM